MSIEKIEMTATRITKQQVEQNDPKGAVLKFVKPDMLCGEIHQISVWQPTVIIDSHMHIQSGRCSTVQFVRNQGPLSPVQAGFKFSRGAVEFFGELSGAGLTLFESVTTKPVKQVAKVLCKVPLVNQVETVFCKTPDSPEEGYFSKNAVFDLVTMQANSTDLIAEFLIDKRNSIVDKYFKNADYCPLYENAPYLFFSSVVMTMDMEYSHIDGYFGLKIYNPLFEKGKPRDITKPDRYWTPAHGKWIETTYIDHENNTATARLLVKFRDKTVYKKLDGSGKVVLINILDDFEDYKESCRKTGTIMGNCCDPENGKPKPVSIEAAPVLMSASETKRYENWEKQLKSTEEAVIKYPLKFLPMFHYDPRRWQFEGENVNADLITKVMGDNALYLGFKMYTAQGYRPWDIRRLPTLKDFYGRCCKNGIPIMNHCTPGGAKSHEADEFYDLEHPFDDKQEEEALRKGRNAKEYFEEHFVSPNAWKKVLDANVELNGESQKLNTLRLCLAHFGGPVEPGPEWSQQIIDMITSNNYPNLYTDISSSFASDKFRKYFKKLFTSELSEEHKKKLRSRILFGTDWYMTYAYGMFNKKNLWAYCAETKTFLDLFDTSLWPYFTQYNPYRFYRLETAVPRIAKTIIKMRNSMVYEGLEKLTPSKINDIDREAAWVKVANKGHENYEEASWIA